MTRDGGDKPGDRPGRQSPRAGRRITKEEAELWEQLGRSLDKVKKKPRVPAHADAPAEAPARSGPDPNRPSGIGHRAPPIASPKSPPEPRAPLPRPPPSRPPALADIDRRTLRRVGSGQVSIDAVLDLHGMTQGAAHSRLRGFLMSCQAKGLRMVLVITGKGAKADRAARFDEWTPGGAERGVLRRSVPMWLDEPELRAIVVSYAAAGVRHGGEGALYIRLRKAQAG